MSRVAHIVRRLAPLRRTSSSRALAVASLSVVLGIALVALGIPLSHYSEAVALQLGSTVLLIAPLVVLQRILSEEFLRRSVDEAEDRIATTLASVSEPTSADSAISEQAAEKYEAAVVDTIHACGMTASKSTEPYAPDYYVRPPNTGPVGVAVRYLRSPIPSGVIAELQALAASVGTPLLLVTNSRLTNSAFTLLKRHSGTPIRHVTWTTDTSPSSLCDAIKTIAE